jgi:hypothetical protein
LLSPQFMIAGGVAVGVTIVALGGYKIVKKIQADNAEKAAATAATTPIPMTGRGRADSGADLDQLDELEPAELSRVELWRRGIADVEAESSGTSIDGEFITPGASRQLIDAGVLDEDDLRSRRSGRTHRSHRAKSEHSVKTSKTSKTTKTTKTSDTRKTKTTVKEGSSKKKEKEPSGLKMLFRSHTSHV